MSRYKSSQRTGQIGENIAEMALRMKGCEMVADMPTPFKIIQRMKVGINEWCRIVFSKKVDGDIRAVIPGSGRSVLAEVKTHSGDRLQHSKLAKHQVDALDEHHKIGGLSLLIWITDYGETHVMKWPIPGFVHRSSLLAKMAPAHEWEGVV